MKINTIGSEDVYFVAPQKYLEDKRFAYTFSLSFKLRLRNASTPVPSSKGDVILEGRWFDQPLVTSFSSPPSATNFSLREVSPTKNVLATREVFSWGYEDFLLFTRPQDKKRVSTHGCKVQGKNLKSVH